MKAEMPPEMGSPRVLLWMASMLVAVSCLGGCRHAATARLQTANTPPVAVSGRLLDINRNPVANARVGIFRGMTPDNAPCPRNLKPEECLEYLFSISADRAHAVAGEDGRFTLQVPGGLALYSDALWAEGVNASGERVRAVWGPLDSSVRRPGQLDNIVLEQVADFTAVILHEGEPVAGAQVNFPYAAPQHADAAGAVAIHREITPRQHLVESVFMLVRAKGFATDYWQGVLRSGQNSQAIELVRESVLTGRVVEADGRPRAKASVKGST